MIRTKISAHHIIVCWRSNGIISPNQNDLYTTRRTKTINRSDKTQIQNADEIILAYKKMAETPSSIQSCGLENRCLLSPIKIEIEKFTARLNSLIKKYNTLPSLYRIKHVIVNLKSLMWFKSLSSLQRMLRILAGELNGC